MSQSDLGDISVGVATQLPVRFKLPGGIQSTYSLGVGFPTGRSPYKINPKTELSTGSGLYSASLGASFSKQVDPVVLFWSLGLSYPFGLKNLNYKVQDTLTLEKVEPGQSYSFSMGWGYALSYANSIFMSFSYSYARSTTYTYKELTAPRKSGDSTSASMGIGMGLMITPKTNVSISVGYGFTGSGFSVNTRIPFDFVL
jgi:opacity protein-like surface antigen